MKVIVTGATGFMGRTLAESLHADGVQVVATGRSVEAGGELRERGIDFRPADIVDAARLTDVFSPADFVVHCAGRSGDWGSYRDFHTTNVVGTRSVALACRRHGIRKIVFVSTPSIYFTGKDRLDIAESDPLPAVQTTHYSKSKLIAEKELLALGNQGLQTIIFRPRAVYGPYDNTIMPRILRMAGKKSLPLINDGRALVDITYVDNFVGAVKQGLAAADDAWNQVYNISNGDPISVRDWFSQVLQIFGRPFRPRNVPEPVAKSMAALMELASMLPFGPKRPLLTRFSVGYMAKSMTLSIEKAKAELGFTPRIGNQQGFQRYAQWVRLAEQ